jgi:putative chitinase
MGCCGSLTSSSTGLPPINAIPPEARGQRFMQSGENVECWANRTQSTQDKSGGTPPPGKIITAAVASACDLSFEQTIEAYPPEGGSVTNWPTPVWTPPIDAVMTYTAGQQLKISGKFTAKDEGQTFELKVTAEFSDGTSDTKSYSLKPVKCNPDEDAITLINPFPGSRITAPFNEIRPKTGGGTRAHKGLDFGNGGGTGPCVSAADGKVIGCNSSDMAGGSGFTGYGYWVQIQHCDKSGKPMCNTFYAHLASISVSTGQTVAKGQTIGQVGGTGPHGPKSYTPHLHFELHIAGSCKDPVPYIQPKAPVKAGVNNAPIATGDPAAPGNSSANYGPAPAPGTSRVEADGTYQSTPTAGENTGKAINKGTVDTANTQCAGKEEPPLNPADTPPPTTEETPPCVEMLTLEQLQKSMPTCGNRCNEYLNAINQVIKEDIVFDLSDKCGTEARERVAMFLAQVGHESGNLAYKNEIWGPTAAQSRYEGRKDLGNTQQGDGYKFRGRGLIQITGRSNYEQFKAASGIDCVSNPDIITSSPYLCAKTAGWYWKTRKLNTKSTDIVGATKKINGGTNGIADRERKWAASKTALNVA